MGNLLAFLLLTVLLPLLINKTTEHRLQWLKPEHLRPIWTVVFALFSSYLLQRQAVLEFVVNLHQKIGGWGYPLAAVTGALLLSGYWWLTGVMLRPAQSHSVPQGPALVPTRVEDEKPPTLLDLFKHDFPNMLKATDTDVDAYTVSSRKGSTVKIKRQIYEDFEAKVKFIGFYISNPSLPGEDFSGQQTFAACLELLSHGSVQGTFDDFEKKVLVMSGYADQMTRQSELSFSGRVFIYHEEFLSIPQKADILKAYKQKTMDVTFRGPDYLGAKVIAWHQEHDKK